MPSPSVLLTPRKFSEILAAFSVHSAFTAVDSGMVDQKQAEQLLLDYGCSKDPEADAREIFSGGHDRIEAKSWLEFTRSLSAVVDIRDVHLVSRIRLQFVHCDTDRDGLLSRSELCGMLRQLLPSGNETAADQIASQFFARKPQETGERISWSQLINEKVLVSRVKGMMQAADEKMLYEEDMEECDGEEEEEEEDMIIMKTQNAEKDETVVKKDAHMEQKDSMKVAQDSSVELKVTPPAPQEDETGSADKSEETEPREDEDYALSLDPTPRPQSSGSENKFRFKLDFSSISSQEELTKDTDNEESDTTVENITEREVLRREREELSALRTELEARKAELDAREAELDRREAELSKREKDVLFALEHIQDRESRIDKRESRFLEQQDELKKVQDEINQLLDHIDPAENERLERAKKRNTLRLKRRSRIIDDTLGSTSGLVAATGQNTASVLASSASPSPDASDSEASNVKALNLDSLGESGSSKDPLERVAKSGKRRSIFLNAGSIGHSSSGSKSRSFLNAFTFFKTLAESQHEDVHYSPRRPHTSR